MATTAIPLVTLPPGVREFGPANTADTETKIVLTVDRTVPGGLNTLGGASLAAVDVFQSGDGGASWFLAVGGTFPGGIIILDRAGHPAATSTLGADVYPGAGRRVKAVVTVSGPSPVAVAGTLTTT